jgi:hypothetical protein
MVRISGESAGDAQDVEAEAVKVTVHTVLSPDEQDAVDTLRGRINGALVGLDGDSQINVLEAVTEFIHSLIDDIVSEFMDPE